jgi:hypothetical protein
MLLCFLTQVGGQVQVGEHFMMSQDPKSCYRRFYMYFHSKDTCGLCKKTGNKFISIPQWHLNVCHCVLYHLVTPFEAIEHYKLTSVTLKSLKVAVLTQAWEYVYKSPHSDTYEPFTMYLLEECEQQAMISNKVEAAISVKLFVSENRSSRFKYWSDKRASCFQLMVNLSDPSWKACQSKVPRALQAMRCISRSFNALSGGLVQFLNGSQTN